MTKNIKYLLILLLVANVSLKAQNRFSHEIGVFVGGAAMQSDFGASKDFDSNTKNAGLGIGIVHYLNFAMDSDGKFVPYSYFNDHFKLRTELSYSSAKLNHYGESADSNSAFGRQLRAMKGETKTTNIGMQLEFHPLSIRDFVSSGDWSPYLGLGAHFSVFNNDVYSDLGPLNTPASTPIKYYGATSSKGGSTWSIVSNIGTRYKVTEVSDVFVELKAQYYFSDWVDGLKPNTVLYPENDSNDWNIWFNLGYIYHIN